MTIERKVGMGIAGQPSGATDVADVFSTYLYDGTGGNRSIVNGIDLSGEGGMVWMKDRKVDNINHVIVDTERGPTKYLYGLSTAAEASLTTSLTSFNSNGFSLGTDDGDWVNKNNRSYVSWTFRKKEKFFDVVTYTGNSVQGRAIPHGLGGPVGMILIKTINTGGGSSMNWGVYHRTLGGTKFLYLNTEEAQGDHDSFWNDTDATSTHFTLGDAAVTNLSGRTYVAYLFADNSAEDAEEQMIKCGSYSGNSSTNGPFVDLGWEPQFVLIKAINKSESWMMFDTMRGISTGGNDAKLSPNTIALEDYDDYVELNATGFTLKTIDAAFNGTNYNYLYMAIRAPMMVEPEAATDVFSMTTTTGAVVHNVGLVPDMAIYTNEASAGQDRQIANRLCGSAYLRTNTTDQEVSAAAGWDEPTGYWQNKHHASNINYLWKRAKGYMDVVAYSGNSTSGRTVAHSLGVVPEMIWIKQRDTTSDRNWNVYHKSLATNNIVKLNLDAAESYGGAFANVSLPTDSNFTVTGSSQVNYSSRGYIAFLFATLAGISKVGSFVGNGSSQTIDCGFSAGARYVLIKRTDDTGNWLNFDTARGIVAGNERSFRFDTTNVGASSDSIDPQNSGFIVNQVADYNVNVSSATYIFYAIA